MLSKIVISAIGKYVPVAVGFLLTWLAATLHIVVTPSSEAALAALCVAVLTAAFYALVKLVERVWPWTAVLIGDRPAQRTNAGAITFNVVAEQNLDEIARKIAARMGNAR